MSYQAHFQCIDGSSPVYSLDEVIYRCPNSGKLLEVVHDLTALKRYSATEWKNIFEKRYRTSEFPYGSGVWAKKEWVLPNIKDEYIVSMYEGNTNLFRAKKLERLFEQDKLWVKLCGNSHTASFKDLGMTVLVSQVKSMMAEGSPVEAIVCASTGDTSAALAAYAANADIQSIILLPKDKVSLAQLIQPISNGACVISLNTDFDGCMSIVQKLAENKSLYLANSMNSLRIEGQKTVGIEIIQQLDWDLPDWFIIPGGNLGNVSALGNGLLMMKELGIIDKLPRLCVAQAHHANPLYLSYLKNFESFESVHAKTTLASAIQIGDPVSIEKAITTLRMFRGVVEEITEDEIANASCLADQSGLFTDPHTGVALATLQKLKKKKIIQKEEKVVIISTAHGLKFIDFKVKYHQNQFKDIIAHYQNSPIELEANMDQVLRVIDKKINKNIQQGLKKPSRFTLNDRL